MPANQLIHETSPYLLQHAHNPVHWFPWGDEALTKAKLEQKPILVSIGYAACHWCHVMEKESFEDEATAALMNDWFVNIKIDREERPDLDHIYMDAVQAISGGGGWPLNVFLTPDAKPFYGGTYFPPVKAYNRLSWKDVLTNIHTAWQERRQEIESQAENLTVHLTSSNNFGKTKKTAIPIQEQDFFTEKNALLIAENILKQADSDWGGFGKAPKFPQTFSIQYLLRHYYFTGNEQSLQHALLSLDKMIYGGIYDQIGGGFARYSTDEQWLAPHFEKMLYDNALLINVLAEAYQITNNELYKKTIKQTLSFVEREMLHELCGFYSAIDADSEGVEGKFYTWAKAEIEELLGDDAAIFCEYYDITEHGNWEHVNILWVQKPLQQFVKEKDISEADFEKLIHTCSERLLLERNKRVKPQLDDKILLGWNALMITAYCKAYAALGENHYKKMAIDAMQFLENHLATENTNWKHTYKNGVAKIPAFLDDYAYLIQAYIQLQEITANQSYLITAKAIIEYVIDNFSDEEELFFYYTNNQQQDVILRKKEVYDGATPSGNAVMAANLYYLSIIFHQNVWQKRSIAMLESLGKAIIRYPTSFGVWGSLFQQLVASTNEIAIVCINFTNLLQEVLKAYIPNKVLQSAALPNANFPLLANKKSGAESLIYVCKNYVCLSPVADLVSLLTLIEKKYAQALD